MEMNHKTKNLIAELEEFAVPLAELTVQAHKILDQVEDIEKRYKALGFTSSEISEVMKSIVKEKAPHLLEDLAILEPDIYG